MMTAKTELMLLHGPIVYGPFVGWAEAYIRLWVSMEYTGYRLVRLYL